MNRSGWFCLCQFPLTCMSGVGSIRPQHLSDNSQLRDENYYDFSASETDYERD